MKTNITRQDIDTSYDSMAKYQKYLKKVLKERDEACDALLTAYSLIIQHHNISAMKKLEWGGYCPVCHLPNHTEPEMDKIRKVLYKKRTKKNKMKTNYIKEQAVKQHCHDHDKQIGEDAMKALDVKVGQYLHKLCTSFNGHHSRLTATQINLKGSVK